MARMASINVSNRIVLEDSVNRKLTTKDDDVTDVAVAIGQDYVAFRLRERNQHSKLQGLPRTYLIPPMHVSNYCTLVRRLCFNLEEENNSFFSSLSQRLSLNRKNAKSVYTEVTSALFKTGINWGRVMTLYSFTGVFAQHFVDSGEVELIPEIMVWLKNLVEQSLKTWINDKGGWDDMVGQFSSNGSWDIQNGILALGGFFALIGLAFFLK